MKNAAALICIFRSNFPMKILRLCPHCLPGNGFRYLSADVREDDIYKLRCPSGHQFISTHAEEKFELLGSLAMRAFVDGYYLQSISTFSASLERCYEWFLRVYFRSKCDLDCLFEEIITSEAKRSEHQLGMFIAIYASEFRNRPSLLPPGARGVGLRNKVVHQGYVPTKDEAVNFSKIVIGIVNSLVEDVTVKFKESADKVRLEKAVEIIKHFSSDQETYFGGYLLTPYRQLGGGNMRSFDEITTQFRYDRDAQRADEIIPSEEWIP